jgi:hypothetical protein
MVPSSLLKTAISASCLTLHPWTNGVLGTLNQLIDTMHCTLTFPVY